MKPEITITGTHVLYTVGVLAVLAQAISHFFFESDTSWWTFSMSVLVCIYAGSELNKRKSK